MSDAKEQESVDLFDAYFDWDPSVDDSVFELHHYYRENTVNRVLQKDFICFRLSAAENFEDKMETHVRQYFTMPATCLFLIETILGM